MIARAHVVRWVPVVLAVGTAVWAASSVKLDREPLRRPSVLAYRVEPGEPIAFAVSSLDRDLALTVESEAPPAKFQVNTTFRDVLGKLRWQGAVTLEADRGATILEENRPATSPRTLRINPESSGLLTVTVDGPGAAVVRLARRNRPDGPLVRRAAARGGELVHLSLDERAPEAPVVPEPGEALAPDSALAYTVRGPGTLRLIVSPPTELMVRTVNHQGAVSQLRQSAGTLSFLPPKDGALTVTLAAPAQPTRVRAFTEGGARQLGLETEGEILPDRNKVVLWRARPFGPPVIATLAGDGNARISLRAAGGHGSRLRWRLIAADRVIATGLAAVPAVPSLFERLAQLHGPGEPRLEVQQVSGQTTEAREATAEPIALMASAPAGARLELIALDAPVDIEVAARDTVELAELAPEYAVPLDRVRLRYAHFERRRHVPFIPDNHAALEVSAGRVELEGQVRLEPLAAPPAPGPFRTVDPLAPRIRQVLAEADSEGGQVGFDVGQPANLHLPEGRLLLDVFFGPEALGGKLRVVVDGEVREERPINVTRSRVRLRDLGTGVHRVLVDGPPGMVLTPARGQGRHYADRAVWRLDRGGSLLVRGQGNLNVVLYSDRFVPELTARVTIAGRPSTGMRAASRPTTLVREVKVPMEALHSVWLDGQGGARARGRFVVRVGEDLGGGRHPVRITLVDGAGRVHARFFETGRASEPRVSYTTTEWAED